MNQKGQWKIALGILLALPALPVLVVCTPVGILMLIAGIVLLVLGIREASYKRPELREFPTEVVINGVHYPKSAFAQVDRCIKGREMVFAIQELRRITGIGPEEAKESG